MRVYKDQAIMNPFAVSCVVPCLQTSILDVNRMDQPYLGISWALHTITATWYLAEIFRHAGYASKQPFQVISMLSVLGPRHQGTTIEVRLMYPDPRKGEAAAQVEAGGYVLLKFDARVHPEVQHAGV